MFIDALSIVCTAIAITAIMYLSWLACVIVVAFISWMRG